MLEAGIVDVERRSVLLDWALCYARLGLRLVPLHSVSHEGCSCRHGLACKIIGKHPRATGWRKAATNDESFVRGWWGRPSPCNIGILVGEADSAHQYGIFVLDVDGPAGFHALDELTRRYGSLPPTWRARSGRVDGGMHFYFLNPTGSKIKRSTGKVGSRLDIITNGFIVAPPSLHSSGNCYRWDDAYAPHATLLASAPDWLIELASSGKESKKSRQNRSVLARGSIATTIDSSAMAPYVRAAVDGECEKVVEATDGERNDTVRNAAFSLGTLVGGGALEYVDAEGALMEAASESGVLEDEPEKTRDTIARSLTAGMQHPRQVPEHSQGAPTAQRVVVTPDGAGMQRGQVPNIRPTIVIGNLGDSVDAAIPALAQYDVYQRSGALVDVVREAQDCQGRILPQGTPRVRLLPTARLRERLDDSAVWIKLGGKHGRVQVRVPPDVVAAVEARGEWPHIRPLAGVVEWPVLRPDGTVLTTAGYDPATKLLCEPSVHVQLPNPTRHQAERALGRLGALVVDSPFFTEAHLYTWIAALLTVVARPAIDGPVPLTLLDANARGAGKTTLADLIGVIVTGRELPRRTAPDDAAEWQKTMLAIAIAADPILLIDNVTRTLASDALDAVLTGSVFRGRVLGKNEELALPVRTTFLVTANNATLSADLIRRSLHVRLEATDEHPEQRTNWRYPDLLGHARNHRASYLSDAFTVLCAYFAAGRPAVPLLPMGNYAPWSSVVRASIVWAGGEDPAETQHGLREAADTERDGLAALLQAWWRLYGGEYKLVSVIMAALQAPPTNMAQGLAKEELYQAIVSLCGGKSLTAVLLGTVLKKYRNKVVDGMLFEGGKKETLGVPWRVVCRASSAPTPVSTQ